MADRYLVMRAVGEAPDPTNPLARYAVEAHDSRTGERRWIVCQIEDEQPDLLDESIGHSPHSGWVVSVSWLPSTGWRSKLEAGGIMGREEEAERRRRQAKDASDE
jgi:hypothetical protein